MSRSVCVSGACVCVYLCLGVPASCWPGLARAGASSSCPLGDRLACTLLCAARKERLPTWAGRRSWPAGRVDARSQPASQPGRPRRGTAR
ncbi:uncharacterized protein B0I36DRAFT_331118 [Microdochium trichocladiopsis]|uniref:Secreted protein n=1 Tax=Microdochium trichocladiopsis TaxID=1682393 RepID=A0A9P8Y352_9PEZI|nr:uncharacterized protein B0I36DRAFT_331118 [Microdochium trichocladiopsis]KAH7026669.1 hypothetical protein B0I36DRAFT_331118 [Microdochium trichocladiopsis]